MSPLQIGRSPLPVTSEVRWRHRFSLLTVLVTVALIAWGGFVTSIEAGMAVPDWPSSFGSYDPLTTGYMDPAHPNAHWWNSLPVLAEHGHRLLGALVGLLTLTLAGWTWQADSRSWMRKLGFFALGLVIAQGVLGGLRVVWASLDLAVVHACVAQLFFATLVALTLFTSQGWLRARSVPGAKAPISSLRTHATLTVVALYGQIILGALLRHPGNGVHPLFAAVHVTGALVVVGLVGATTAYVYKYFWSERLLRRGALFMAGTVSVQFLLGLTAYLVLLQEAAAARQSVLQVVLNCTHLVVGALLMAAAVTLALLALRRSEPAGASDRLSSDTILQPAGS